MMLATDIPAARSPVSEAPITIPGPSGPQIVPDPTPDLPEPAPVGPDPPTPDPGPLPPDDPAPPIPDEPLPHGI
jgi:hypothetical protein